MIAAVAKNNAIGINNAMPWHLPEDLKRFKAVTIGKPIIMGRKTFESLGKLLPERENIVITRDKELCYDGVHIVNSINSALSLAEDLGSVDGVNEFFIIGGAEIYRQALPQAERLYLTRVNQTFEGDSFFPEINESEWLEISREDHYAKDNQNLSYSYLVLDRK